MSKKEETYFSTIKEGFVSLMEGLKLTFKHFKAASQKRKPIGIEDKDYFLQDTGIVTTEYPYEAIPIPDNGRYRLNNEIDDCIVCDLCAKICPVNCIDIVPVKSPEEIGKTSDGTTKRIYAATFDIDMAKCCYCGLCTTVCPTECLTMTKTFDYSEYDVRNMNYHFTDLSPTEAEEKKKIYEEFEKEKQRLKAEGNKIKETTTTENKEGTTELPKPKPSFKPVVKAPVKTEEKKEETAESSAEEKAELPKPKPVFKPVIKAPVKTEEKKEEPNTQEPENKTEENNSPPPPKPKVIFKPVIKAPVKTEEKKEEPKTEEPENKPEDSIQPPKKDDQNS
jgi:formate hydrogenlyase subunit 6/NADH:ubiquinone oxidoreductase subunit I